jgi:hypothetical protein
VSLVTGIKTAAGYELQWVYDQGGSVSPEGDAQLTPLVQHYKHFNLTDEELGRTQRYNCWGFTFLERRYWLNDEVDKILADNCVPVAPPSLLPGDIIRYRDSSNVTTHTGRVWQVNGAGDCAFVRSKWGGWAEYVHDPRHPYIFTDAVYGTNLAYFRQTAPLQGLGDLWIRDAASDSGEQRSPNGWESPDIMVDAPPFGSVDVNPVFGVVNRVSAMVHNRGDVPIANAHVRYFWADPFAGFAPSQWQLIPGTALHPNPTNGFAAPANSSVEAPYVEWTPAPVPGAIDPAHQCLLAVAFVNDDPQDSACPDQIVYPFDILWDNNVAARNVHIVTLVPNGKANLEFRLGVPFDQVDRVMAKINFRLSVVPRLPIFGIAQTIEPPTVAITLGDRKPLKLVRAKPVQPLRLVTGSPAVRVADPVLMPRAAVVSHGPMAERIVASRQVPKIPISVGSPVLVKLQMTAPKTARPGSNFYLRIEQEIDGQVTGGYTVVITVA